MQSNTPTSPSKKRRLSQSLERLTNALSPKKPRSPSSAQSQPFTPTPSPLSSPSKPRTTWTINPPLHEVETTAPMPNADDQLPSLDGAMDLDTAGLHESMFNMQLREQNDDGSSPLDQESPSTNLSPSSKDKMHLDTQADYRSHFKRRVSHSPPPAPPPTMRGTPVFGVPSLGPPNLREYQMPWPSASGEALPPPTLRDLGGITSAESHQGRHERTGEMELESPTREEVRDRDFQVTQQVMQAAANRGRLMCSRVGTASAEVGAQGVTTLNQKMDIELHNPWAVGDERYTEEGPSRMARRRFDIAEEAYPHLEPWEARRQYYVDDVLQGSGKRDG
ncbi:MAG: hypothetical protein MMC23_000694 [Stictis urceolatum]|nr:hypothetical protein [Stictis urceolata]